MRLYSIIFLVLLTVAFAAACATTQPSQQANAPITQPAQDTKPSAQQPKATETQSEVSSEVNILLNRSKSKIKNIYYHYRGPETGNDFHEFYIKGSKIKYVPAREIKALDQKDSYDVIYIDTVAKNAQSYCDAAYCAYKGKKFDLDYDKAYILTVFDWVNGMSKAEKIGEEVIDDRQTWKVEANNGIMWFDVFYGIPLRVEANGNVYHYQQISANTVKDSDVQPGSSD